MNTTTALPKIMTDADLARQSRLCVMRSAAYDDLINGTAREEIGPRLRPDVRAQLPAALAAAEAEAAPAARETVMIEITKFVGLVGQHWSQDGRTEYLRLATQELAGFPGGMVIDSLSRARRCISDGRLLVPWVCEDVVPKAAKLKVEIGRLQELTEIAAETSGE